MVKVKHPLEKYNRHQEEFLNACPASQRRMHELLFSVGNITYRYHLEARNCEPTEIDFEEWLEGLSDNIRKDMKAQGFEKCKGVLSFTRYVMEKKDMGLDEYVKNNLGSDYDEYLELLKKD